MLIKYTHLSCCYVDKSSILPLGCFILTLSFVTFTLILLFSTILLFRITRSFNFVIFLVIIIFSPNTGITFSSSFVLIGTSSPVCFISPDFFAVSFFPDNTFLRSDRIPPPLLIGLPLTYISSYVTGTLTSSVFVTHLFSMTVLLKIDCFDMAGFSSTTGIVCSVVGVNDIEEGDGDEASSKELFSEEPLLLLLLSVIFMYMRLQIMHYKNIQES